MNLEKIEQLKKDFKAKAEKILATFSEYITKISPDTINLAKINGLDAIRENVHNGNIIVNKYMQRGVKIDPINALEWKKVSEVVDKALKAENLITRNDGVSLIGTLPDMDSDMRKSLAKEVSESKEKYKNSLNDLRRVCMKDIKDMKISEDMQRTANNDIDTIKDKIQAELEKICTNKQNALKG